MNQLNEYLYKNPTPAPASDNSDSIEYKDPAAAIDTVKDNE